MVHNRTEDMGVNMWFKEMPDLLQREKEILEGKGFYLDEDELINNKVVFYGRAFYTKGYPLKIDYPHGYPSFPPSVYSKVDDSKMLRRHQVKSTKSLCLFGFSSERWRADFTAREVLDEVEELLLKYSPQNYDPEYDGNDYVPEPIIDQVVKNNGDILIPPPFGDFLFDDLKDRQSAQLKYSSITKRGVLISIGESAKRKSINESYKNWFEDATLFNARLYRLSEPPSIEPKKALQDMINNYSYRLPKRGNDFLVLVFNDESGDKDNFRLSWIVMRIIQSEPYWGKCHLVSSHDLAIRTPYGKNLTDKVVTIVGAGSIGSLVATTLGQEGVGTLNLIDSDIYEPANSVRHQVKQYMFGVPKVNALENRIKELSPLTKVESFYWNVGTSNETNQFNKMEEKFWDTDLVIDTTGEHSVSHYLNRLSIKFKTPLIVASVTNGAWSCEIVKVLPEITGCWICWNRKYGNSKPPSSPQGKYQFAPGCSQPTFIGGVSSINIAGGLIAQSAIDILLTGVTNEEEYIVWRARDNKGNRSYEIKSYENQPLNDCVVCFND